MKITIHRGTHEIGGSCVEVRSANSRIIIDIGMPLVNKGGERFDFKDYEGLSGPELVEKKVLPDVPGLYRWDTENKTPDGILISHAHIDHYGFYNYLNEDIRFYLGEASQRIIGLTAVFTSVKGTITNYFNFRSGKPLTCGDFTITPFLMDHSAFDAYAFLIEADRKSIIYSGDFREHGRKSKAFYYFLAKAPSGIDALLLEGTMLGREVEKTKTEKEIEGEITEITGRSKNIVLMYTSSQNIDRLVSFYRASLRSNKLFVIDFYTAHVLDIVKDYGKLPYPSKNFPNIRVMFPYWLSKRISDEGRQKLLYKFRKYKIEKKEISDQRKDIMMLVRPSMLSDLERIDSLENSDFIYSMWKGYLEENSIKRMLEYTRGKNMKFHNIHTGGHADLKTLRKVTQKLKPKVIIPIHTLHPDKYNSICDDTVILSDGECYDIQ